MRRALAYRLKLVGWTFPLLGLTVAGFGLLLSTWLALPYVLVWVGIPVVIACVWLTRKVTGAYRWISTNVVGVPIRRPYRPWARGHIGRKLIGLSQDPASWRDLAWLLVDSTLGQLVYVVVLTLFLSILWYGVYPLLWWILVRAGGPDTATMVLRNDLGVWTMDSQADAFAGFPIAAGFAALWWWLTPVLLRGYARLSRMLLGPTLAARVQQLTESRAEVVDAQAAELRRIERDLHDGAQARLVALGMAVGMAEELMRTDPEAAAKLLAEARQDSDKALAELRQLVRGIHPPVLADRGLAGAVQALALAHPLPVEVVDELPGRPLAPVESAAYFATAETLTNVAKHARARSVAVRMGYEDSRLVVTVSDDGRGGATMTGVGGLDGIRRRLSAFDGTVGITSPVGGPTVITMEIPCELSSAKTTPSSGTA
jgi:signal transduction histidine kinase